MKTISVEYKMDFLGMIFSVHFCVTIRCSLVPPPDNYCIVQKAFNNCFINYFYCTEMSNEVQLFKFINISHTENCSFFRCKSFSFKSKNQHSILSYCISKRVSVFRKCKSDVSYVVAIIYKTNKITTHKYIQHLDYK